MHRYPQFIHKNPQFIRRLAIGKGFFLSLANRDKAKR
jgi:hypothetical protein